MHPTSTGCYADQVLFQHQPDLVSLPAYFKRAGYNTYGGGKVFHHMPGYLDLPAYTEYYHWNPAEKRRGWGYNAWSTDNPATPKKTPASVAGEIVGQKMEHGMIPDELEPQMADTLTTDYAVRKLQEKHDRPFFLSIGLYAPHKPNYVPRKYHAMYPLDQIRVPEIKPDDLDDLPAGVQQKMVRSKKREFDPLAARDAIRPEIQSYLAGISYADTQLGRILGWFAVEKCDGCRGYWDGTTMWSRSGRVIPIPDPWRAKLPHMHLDGEIYAGRGQWKTTVKAVVRGVWEPYVCYMVFDAPKVEAHWPKRLAAAEKALRGKFAAAARRRRRRDASPPHRVLFNHAHGQRA